MEHENSAPVKSCRLLGAFQAYVDGEPIQFGYRQAEHLIAYLVLYGRSSRTQVARALWPGSQRERAMLSLRQALSKVNRSASTNWIDADRVSLVLARGVVADIDEVRKKLEHTDTSELEAELSTPLCENWLVPWMDQPRLQWRQLTMKCSTRSDLHALVSRTSSGQVSSAPTVTALFELVDWMRLRSVSHARELVARCISLLPSAHALDVIAHVGPLFATNQPPKSVDFPVLENLARAHYLIGERSQAMDTYSLVANEALRQSNWLTAASAAGSMAVVLRESGDAKGAYRLMRTWMPRVAGRTELGNVFIQVQAGMARAHLGELSEGIAMNEAVQGPMRTECHIITQMFYEINMSFLYHDVGRSTEAWNGYEIGSKHAEYVQDILGTLTLEALHAVLTSENQPQQSAAQLETVMHEAIRLDYLHLATIAADRLAEVYSRADAWKKCATAILFSQALRAAQSSYPTELEHRLIRHTVGQLQTAVGLHQAQEWLAAPLPDLSTYR